jgi:methyl-accepting chemotaxis protein
MRIKSLEFRLISLFGLCLLMTIAALIFYAVVSTRSTEEFVVATSTEFATENAKQRLVDNADATALKIRTEIEVALNSARTLRTCFPVSKIRASV